MVYFIFSPDDPRTLVKIGFTRGTLKSRLAAMQVGHPFRLFAIMTMEGDRLTEYNLHKQFKASKVHGEWFEPTQDLIDFIESRIGDKISSEMEESLKDPTKIERLSTLMDWNPIETRYEIRRYLVGKSSVQHENG